MHPFRFLNTHERVFPKAVPTFDPERAKVLHHHEVREGACGLVGLESALRARFLYC